MAGWWSVAGIRLNHRLRSPGVEVWCNHRDISPQYPASQMTERQIKLIIIFLAKSLTPVLARQAVCELDESGEGSVRGSIRLEGDSRATQYVVTTQHHLHQHQAGDIFICSLLSLGLVSVADWEV